jgi:hypothetical protein
MAVKLEPPFKTAPLENGFFSKAWEMFLRALINRQEMIVIEFTGNGVLNQFTLSSEPKDKDHTMVFVNGVYKHKDSYSVSGNKIIFLAAPANGSKIEVTTHGR